MSAVIFEGSHTAPSAGRTLGEGITITHMRYTNISCMNTRTNHLHCLVSDEYTPHEGQATPANNGRHDRVLRNDGATRAYAVEQRHADMHAEVHSIIGLCCVCVALNKACPTNYSHALR